MRLDDLRDAESGGAGHVGKVGTVVAHRDEQRVAAAVIAGFDRYTGRHREQPVAELDDVDAGDESDQHRLGCRYQILDLGDPGLTQVGRHGQVGGEIAGVQQHRPIAGGQQAGGHANACTVIPVSCSACRTSGGHVDRAWAVTVDANTLGVDLDVRSVDRGDHTFGDETNHPGGHRRGFTEQRSGLIARNQGPAGRCSHDRRMPPGPPKTGLLGELEQGRTRQAEHRQSGVDGAHGVDDRLRLPW